MKDLLLDAKGDLLINKEIGDVQLTDSVKQAIGIRLRWFANEWKLGPSLGIDYFGELFTKNPSKVLLEGRMREAIESIVEVKEVTSLTIDIDKKNRKLLVSFAVLVGENETEGRLTVDV